MEVEATQALSLSEKAFNSLANFYSEEDSEPDLTDIEYSDTDDMDVHDIKFRQYQSIFQIVDMEVGNYKVAIRKTFNNDNNRLSKLLRLDITRTCTHHVGTSTYVCTCIKI